MFSQAYSHHNYSKKLFSFFVQLKSLAFGRNIRRQMGCFHMDYIYNTLLYSQLSRQALDGRVGCVAGNIGA